MNWPMDFPRRWGLDLLLVGADKWRREHATHFLLRDYQILDRWHAERALHEIARERGGLKFMREQRPSLLYPFYPTHTPTNDYAQAQEDQRCLKQLIEALGLRHSPRGKPPEFARFYVCRRNRRVYATPSLPLPMPTQSKQPESSDPSHYVVIQAVTAKKAPVPGVRLELVCAGGEVRTMMTGPDGCVRVDRIEAAPVTVRVVSLDCSMWRALNGEAVRPSSDDSALRWHQVVPGECLSTVAYMHGIRGWKLLWDHAKNEPLRQKRQSPHVLMPGDQVAVPGARVHEIVCATDATRVIEVQPAPERTARVRFQNLAGEPIPDLAYRYTVSGKQASGTTPTSADGWLEERVPLTTGVVELELAERRPTLAVQLGALRPIRDEDTKRPISAGICARLRALGYAAGTPADTLTPEVQQALHIFQSLAMKRDEPTGEADEETVSELARVALV